MPHSYHFPMTLMLDHVMHVAPRRVLDVGIGFGKWGFLVRELLDFTQGRLEPETWKTEIIGVEAFDTVRRSMSGCTTESFAPT